MNPVWIPIIAIPTVLIALPWIVLHYVTQWKKSTAMTNEDEALLDQMYETARRLEERLGTVERILAADNPDFRPLRGPIGEDYRLEGRN